MSEADTCFLYSLELESKNEITKWDEIGLREILDFICYMLYVHSQGWKTRVLNFSILEGTTFPLKFWIKYFEHS